MTTRRSLAGGAVLALLGTAGALAAPPSAQSDDAKLIAIGWEAAPLVAEYRSLLATWWTLSEGSPSLNSHAAKMTPICDRLDAMMDEAIDLKASTPEAIRAKALLLKHQLTVEGESDGKMDLACPAQTLAWSLVCDVVGRA